MEPNQEPKNLSVNRHREPLIPDGSGDRQKNEIDRIQAELKAAAEQQIGKSREQLVAEAEKLYATGSEMDRDWADEIMEQVKRIDSASQG